MIFTDRERRSWWDLFTTEGFRHCYVARWDEWSQRWLFIDWRETRLDFNILFDFEMERIIRSTRNNKGTVVEYYTTLDLEGTDHHNLFQYCSNHIAKALGFGAHLILTPRALYRRLRASGGEVVYSWRDHEN